MRELYTDLVLRSAEYSFEDWECGHRTATKISFINSLSGNSAASAPISTFMCLWAIYVVPGSVYNLHISSSSIGRPIVGIYKSLTDAWMWKLGLRPRYSFSGNICFEISVFCLCSAQPFGGFLFYTYFRQTVVKSDSTTPADLQRYCSLERFEQ